MECCTSWVAHSLLWGLLIHELALTQRPLAGSHTHLLPKVCRRHHDSKINGRFEDRPALLSSGWLVGRHHMSPNACYVTPAQAGTHVVINIARAVLVTIKIRYRSG